MKKESFRTGINYQECTYRNEANWSYPKWQVVDIDGEVLFEEIIFNTKDKFKTLSTLIEEVEKEIDKAELLKKFLPLIKKQAEEIINFDKQKRIDELQKEIDELQKEFK